MKTVMFKCPHCDNYLLKTQCPECDVAAVNPNPARYSPQDRYGKYRRALKKEAGGV